MSVDCDREDLIELLAWYGELGVDCAVADDAVDWLAHGDAAPGAAIRQALRASQPGPSAAAAGAVQGRSSMPFAQSGPEQRREPVRQVTRQPGTAAVPARAAGRAPADAAAGHGGRQGAAGARKIAESATTLEELRQGLEGFEGCALRATAKNTCFFRGAPSARVMVIGEAPGRDEDLAGIPFVGRAGQLLDRMLAAIGLAESDVHITNVVYWRPPGNRTPTLQETESCRPFLERQVQLVAPEFVLLVGGAAAKSVLQTNDGIMRLRGKWRDVSLGGHNVRALPTLHPAYLLRTPAAKRQAWRDLLNLQKMLSE